MNEQTLPPDTRRKLHTMPLMIDAFSVEELPVENENNVQVRLVLAGDGRDPKWPIDADALSLGLTKDQAGGLYQALRDVVHK